jgi:glycerate kinase
MADGGEGMVAAYLSVIGGERRVVRVTGPLGEPVDAAYAVLPDGSAVAEMASAAGLPQVGDRKDPLRATTRGVGEIVLDAAAHGCRRLLMGLGGSCTNDCGIGMAAALGYRFLDSSGAEVEPLAMNLGEIARIVDPRHMPDIAITAACDVDNPLVGPDGATYTFGPQKGADAACLARLEEGMCSFARVLERHFSTPVADCPHGGAAGGMGAAVLTMLRGGLKSGIDALLDAAQFDRLIADADLVVTGEGRIDWQSAHGKVPMGVGLRCKKAGVPCIALCGCVGPRAEEVYDCGITAVFSSLREAAPFEQVRGHSAENLTFLTDSVMRLLAAL